MEDRLVRAHVWVTGRVQGVFFRSETQRAAHGFGVTGWVRNLPDGRVEAVFQGPRALVEQAIDWIRVGPPRAEVDDIEVVWETPEAESGFDVRH